MDRGGGLDYKTKTGPVNMFGQRIHVPSDGPNKPKFEIPESSSRARELHRARRDIRRYKEGRRDAELKKAQAESELSTARKTVKDLASLIEESNSRMKAKNRSIEPSIEVFSGPKRGYAEVMQELEVVKKELSKLKLDMACVLEEKSRAEKEAEIANLKLKTNSKSVEAIGKEIEEVNEEHVLVELARIEAMKECGEIKAEREKEASEFSVAAERKREKIKEMVEEIDGAKELESKLAVTLTDVSVLQSELKSVRRMSKEGDFQGGVDETEGSPIIEELEAAKKELGSIREEGIQFMASMDVIRDELKHIREETARCRKVEEKSNLTVKNLNSKLLRAKSKLESVTAAEEKAREIAGNLSLTLEQLKTEAEASKKEKELIIEETANIRAEIEKTELEIDSTEEQLQAAMQELNSIKSSEALALENLKSLIENTALTRASASQEGSFITISKFEHEYLTARAGGAEELADKKVAAAQAWIEALKASEKETLMKIEMAQKEIRETRMEEEKEVFTTERSLSAKRNVEGELRNWRHKRENNTEAENKQPGPGRRHSKGVGNLTPSRRAKNRKSASPSTRLTRTGSISVKRKTKVIPNFTKLFASKSGDENS